MKCHTLAGNARVAESPPSRVEWIEITIVWSYGTIGRSPPSRVEWIEMMADTERLILYASPPSRVEWIEIKKRCKNPKPISRLRPRGWSGLKSWFYTQDSELEVCLRPRGWSGLKSSIGVGVLLIFMSPPSRVEWIEIELHLKHIDTGYRSPPSRVEWIEMLSKQIYKDRVYVSAFAGGVD